MNIEGSNLLSMLSGSEAPASNAPGLLPTNGDNLGFSAAFMEQLSALQSSIGNVAAQGSVLQNPDIGKLPADAQAAMQSFAALFGKNLPHAGKVEQNINLDDTMQALADVMQHLQAFASPPVAPASTAEVAVEAVAVQPKPVVIAESDTEQSVDVGLLMQLQSQQPSQQAAGTVNDQVLAVADGEAANKTEASAVDDKAVSVDRPVTDQVLAPVAVQPAIVVMPAVESVVPLVSQETASPVLSMPTTRKSPAASQLISRDNLSLPQAVAEQSDDFGLEFNRSIAAAQQQGNAGNEQSARDAQIDLPKGEKLLAPLDSTSPGATNINPSVAELADKRSINFGGELSRLIQALPTNDSAKAEVPAITTQLGKPAWSEDLGQKLIWMNKQAMPSAEIRLNPEHLGPVLVKIDVHQDQTSITFTAQHQAVRDAIEAAIPKLREMFNGQQLQLGDVNVSQHQQQSEQRQARDFFQAASEQGRRGQANGDEATGAGISESQDIADEIEAGRAIAGNGLLSLFA
jgi:flagellar hook-length control protein FliK